MNKFDAGESTRTVDVYADYRKIHYNNTVPDSRVLVFLTGFCIGMVFFYLSKGQDAGIGRLLDREHLVKLQDFEVNRSGLFEYVAGLRLRQLILCVICSFSSIGCILAYSITGWYGFEAGLVIFSLVYRHGIKGIFVTLSMFLPQWIFYAAVFLIIFGGCWQGDTKSCHNEVTEKIAGFRKKILVLVLFGVGVLCEVYVNPGIVGKIAMFFK